MYIKYFPAYCLINVLLSFSLQVLYPDFYLFRNYKSECNPFELKGPAVFLLIITIVF